MRHVKQRPGECLLASLAMLTGTPMSKVRDEALNVTGGIPWPETVNRRTGLFWDSVSAIGVNLGIERFTERLHSNARMLPGGNRPSIPTLPWGRGIIIFTKAVSPTQSHAVVYNNGLIHDPMLNKPETLLAWWKRVESYIGDFTITPYQTEVRPRATGHSSVKPR